MIVRYGFMTVLKVLTIMMNAKDIWNLIYTTNISHVMNGPCSKYVARCTISTVITRCSYQRHYLGSPPYVFMLWCFSPLVINTLYSFQSKTELQRRYENVVNFPYNRITLSEINKYFNAFYTIEVILLAFFAYGTITIFNT